MLVFEKRFTGPNVVFKQAKETLVEFKQAQGNLGREQTVNVVARRGAKWKAPANRFVKANWDAIVDSKKKRMGIRVVIRDEKGEVLVSR